MTSLMLVCTIRRYRSHTLIADVCKASNAPNVPTPDWFPSSILLNLGTFSAFLYSALYLLMEPVAGGLLFPLIISGTIYSNRLLDIYGATANKWAGGVFVFSWIAQFVGHGKFEGRAPALLDNLVQALFLAPFFVWMEVLFMLGYRPDLKKRLDAAVQVEIEKFQREKEKSKVNGSATGKAH
jgi:uncharacterized membrane protein YGL010W